MAIIVTGAAGFIGANLVKSLNALGYTEIIAVDNLTNGSKIKNLADCEIIDFIDKHDFVNHIISGKSLGKIQHVFHQGACSATVNQDGRYMMENNYRYSCHLLDYVSQFSIPMTYASSAAVYGNNQQFIERRECEAPLNVYGYSKFLFDQVVRRRIANKQSTIPVVGLRYFNVYGMRELHKERMASVVLHNFHQYQATGKVQLFAACQGYAAGEQVRDFIMVDDVVKVNLHFFKQAQKGQAVSGIFNCGTAKARSFNALALATVNACRVHDGQALLSLAEANGQGIINYIPFPDDLSGRYQCYTEADLTQLRSVAGYVDDFLSLEDGITRYVNALLG